MGPPSPSLLLCLKYNCQLPGSIPSRCCCIHLSPETSSGISPVCWKALLLPQKLPVIQPSDFDEVPGGWDTDLFSALPSWGIDCISAARPWCFLLAPSELGMDPTLEASPHKPHYRNFLLDIGERGAEGQSSFCSEVRP